MSCVGPNDDTTYTFKILIGTSVSSGSMIAGVVASGPRFMSGRSGSQRNVSASERHD